jgi:arylsulfatase A-like enzyme
MNRRNFLSTGLAAATGGGLTLRAQDVFPTRLNLLYILVDQLSGLALPLHDPNSRLPNCAALAKAGVTFSRAYTGAMTCGPSRACLDTGLFTQAHSIGGGYRPPASMATLPKTLAAAGYVLSHPDGYSLEAERAAHEKWLADLGYAGPLSSINGVEAMARYRDLPLKWKCGRAGVAPEHGFEAYCAQRAVRFLETNRDRAFACFLQLRGPHDPYMTPRPFDTLIDPAKLALPPYRAGEYANKPPRQQRSFQTQGAARMSDAQLREVLALYYGMAAYSDTAIGQVLARVSELGLDDRTVVILVSDHGDTMGRHRMMSKDFAFYEPAMRIPMVIRAPGRRPRGVVHEDPVSGIDVYPTLCDLLSLPQPKDIHGVSLVRRWESGERDPERTIFSSQGTPGKDRAVMMRTRQLKLTRYDDGGGELYDLVKDPDELENRLEDRGYAAIRTRLTRQLEDWERRYPIRG